VPLALGEATAGLLGLAALVLLPGLVIVRSGWPFVPFLSISYWLVTWGWLTPGGPGRERFLQVSLVLSGVLAALRLLKPLGARHPSWPTVAVVTFALLRLLPLAAWPAAPGREAGFASAQALLLTWRDGIPASFEPLYPVAGFGLGGFGPAALAADVSLLTGTPPHRALLAVELAAEGLLALALFALLRRYSSLPAAAGLSLVAAALGLMAAARWEGMGGVALALALWTAGGSLVLGGAGRSTAVAAALLWAAALVTLGIPRGAPLAALTVLVVAAARVDLRRLGLAAGCGALLAAPALWRTAADLAEARVPWQAGTLAAVLALVLTAARARTWAGRPWVVVLAAATVLGATLLDWTTRTARVEVTTDGLAAADWLREHSRPIDVVCSDLEAARAWLPALAGRAVHPPLLPGRGSLQLLDRRLRPCRFRVLRTADRMTVRRLDFEPGAP
jgi:hypothetical protein